MDEMTKDFFKFVAVAAAAFIALFVAAFMLLNHFATFPGHVVCRSGGVLTFDEDTIYANPDHDHIYVKRLDGSEVRVSGDCILTERKP